MTEQARMLLIECDRAVCVGGKWDGWLFWLHPNGNWISARKLIETDPTIDPLFSMMEHPQENAMDHIAQDIRDGIFPKKSKGTI